MALKKYSLILGIATLLLGSVHADENDRKAMIKDLDVLQHHFTNHYAPSNLKKELFGWNMQQQFEQAKKQIETKNSMSVKEYQKMLKGIFQSTSDYHVQHQFCSTEWAFFPLSLQSINGRYFIECPEEIGVDVQEFLFLDEDSDQMSIEIPGQLNTGDEAIAFNGVAIRDAIEKIIDDVLGGDRTATGYALANKAIFHRSGTHGETVPSGSFQLTVKHKSNGRVSTYDFPWVYSRELVKEPKASVAFVEISSKFTPAKLPLDGISKKDYSVAYAKHLLKRSFVKTKKLNQKLEENGENEDQRTKGFLPPLGPVLWETDPQDHVYAYLYQNQSRQRIGYLALPTFDADEEIFREIVQILKRFDRESDALVIDITNNGGGYLYFMYAVLSALTDQPLKTLSSEQILIQADVYDALSLSRICKTSYADDETMTSWFMGYPVDDFVRQELINYTESIVSSWNAGKRMTHLLPMEFTQLRPHPEVQYTKPLLVLTNELDFSCADLFPAILQDNGRAVIFGKKTAGAGGYVKQYSYPSLFGLSMFSLTGSVVYRLDGSPVENMGVEPDVPYEMTMRDLEENYVDYVKAVNNAVRALVR